MKITKAILVSLLLVNLTYADGERIAHASCIDYASFGGMNKTSGTHDVVVHNLTNQNQVVHVEFKDCIDKFPCGVKIIDKVLKPNERWFSGIYQVYTKFHYRTPNLLIHKTYTTISGYIDLNTENKCYVRILKD